ncbi:MAG: S8 family serine peptidase, partial [Candidatus Thermoplasmatota archaeon]|nr:S8 family serine peptidase [Candidatus Thermoplasmatota archaeon]
MKKSTVLSRIILGLLIITIPITGITGYDTLPDIDTKRIILVETKELDQKNLEALGARILETYDTSLLIETASSVIPEIQKHSSFINTLQHRTILSINDHTFDISKGEPDLPQALQRKEYTPNENGVYIIHMIGPLAKGWRPILEEMGVEVLHYIPNYAYMVRMTPDYAHKIMNLSFVDWVGIYHPFYKLQQGIQPGLITFELLPIADKKTLTSIDEITEILGVDGTSEEGIRCISMVSTQDELYQLAHINEVSYISQYGEPTLHSEMDSQIIGGGAWIMDEDDNLSTPYRVHDAAGAYINQLGYTGDGVIIAIADTGLGNGSLGDAGHLDFTGRIIGGYGFDVQDEWQDGHGHGTHCAGSAAGDTYQGTTVTYGGHGPYYGGQGLAYGSMVYAVKIFSDTGGWIGPDDPYRIVEVAQQHADAYVHSNSWGDMYGNGMYGTNDYAYDKAVRDADRETPGNQPIIITISAGNSGPSHQTISSPANAKNVITIGATESYMPESTSYGNTYNNGNNPDAIVSFSSRGWTADNRVKPDVVAPGQAILSTRSPNAFGSNLHGLYTLDPRYEWGSGTSMSAPAVAGAAAVTVQWYEQNQGKRPSPAMVKALLINTAYDLNDTNGNTDPIPNRLEGWGMVDLSKLQYPSDDPLSFYLIDQEHIFTESGQVKEHLIMIDNEQMPLKISLVWTDTEAFSGTGSGRTLINDLNLEVVSPTGNIYRGNAFQDGWTQADTDT